MSKRQDTKSEVPMVELYQDQFFTSPLCPDMEIAIGFAETMQWPDDWYNKERRERCVSVVYFKPARGGWRMYWVGQPEHYSGKAYATEIQSDEMRECKFYGLRAFFTHDGLVLRCVLRTGWDMKRDGEVEDVR